MGVSYLRVSVTDRCNLRCRYCLPPAGVKPVAHEEVLRFEEIARVVRAAIRVGVRKVRLTGGEPLVRKHLSRLVAKLAELDLVDDLSLTTNGIFLAEQAKELKVAGLHRVNVSLDTLDSERYRFITRGGELARVWEGIELALELGLEPVKLNVVVIKGFNEDELVKLASLSLERPLHVRFIELMPFGPARAWFREAFLSAAAVRAQLEKHFGPLLEVKKLRGAGPACYHRIPGAQGTVGFIAGMSGHICFSCNRLRLSATGMLHPCLFGKGEVDLKGPLRAGAGEEELVRLLAQAIALKRSRPSSLPEIDHLSRLGG
ncbi:GTP 3',8-cyclase MoaA [Desulfothermobacter acidiphilus]|uniref:GTP 3',8-cyclase MoaA n=1 Tax=Desulfothermobacter acidiphilus TaxID=1938353 RepID=UPI003F8B2D07